MSSGGSSSVGFQFKIGSRTVTVQKTATGVTLVDGAVRKKYDYDKLKDAAKSKEGYKELSMADIAAMHEKRRNKPDYEHGLGTPWENKDNREAARISRLANRITRRRRRR